MSSFTEIETILNIDQKYHVESQSYNSKYKIHQNRYTYYMGKDYYTVRFVFPLLASSHGMILYFTGRMAALIGFLISTTRVESWRFGIDSINSHYLELIPKLVKCTALSSSSTVSTVHAH